MSDSPGVVTVHRFVQAKNAKGSYSDYAVGYMGRPEAFDEEKHLDDTLYHDSNPLRDVGGYMGNNEKTDGLFDAKMDILDERDKHDYSEMFNAAQAADSCLYQTVISFDNDYLRAHGVDFSSPDGLCDIKEMARLAVSDLIANSHLDERNAIWTGAIHTNTDNIHIHIAITEIEKTKSPRDMLPEKAIDKMKSRVANMLMGDEKIIQLSDYLKKELPHEIRTVALEAGNELTALTHLLPDDCAWQYNRPSMAPYRTKIDHCVDTIIRSNPELAAKYADALGLLENYRQDVQDVYGAGKHDRAQEMMDNKLEDFYARAGNQLLDEAKELKRCMSPEDERENGLPGGPKGEKSETDGMPAPSPPVGDEAPDFVDHTPPSSEGKNGLPGRPEGEKSEISDDVPLPGENDVPPELDVPIDLGYAPDPPAKSPDEIDRLIDRAEHGDIRAKYDLGMRALQGRGVEKDSALAFQIMKDAADHGNPVAQYKLAQMYRDGIGAPAPPADGESSSVFWTDKNSFHADEYFHKAFQGFMEQAQGGNAYANYRLAMMYEKGDGVPKDNQKKQEYLHEAAYLGHAQSMYLLGKQFITSFADFDEGLRYLEMAEAKGHAKAAYMLGQTYLSASDNETAFAYMQRAADLGDRPAAYVLGKMYRDGIGTPADAEKAEKYLKAGANVFWTDEYRTARAYLYGSQEVKQDFAVALDLLKEEAAKGNAFAMCDVGRIYERGLGVDRDPDMASRYYTEGLAALISVEEINHDAYIQYRIGKMYRFGQGAEQSDLDAAEWFERSADQGNQFAQYSLGGMYYRGQGVEQDFGRAFDLYRDSAKQKNAFASYELGKMYRDGIGTAPDAAKSENFFKQAFAGFKEIEKANPDDKIQYRLGKMLETGTGTQKDLDAATQYYEKSAKLKNPNAQYALARIYLDSNDPEKTKRAAMWLKKSAAQQNPYARYTLGKLLVDGKVIKQNLKAALICFESVTEEHPYAAYTAARMYRDGVGTEKNAELADKYFTTAFQKFTAAEIETPDANLEYRLGTMLLSGEGCKRDPARALSYLKAACDKEHPSAQYMLGKMYLKGDVVAKDEKQAFVLIKAAADHDHSFAAYTAGQMYREGVGTQKDEQAAQKYFQKAFEAYQKGEKEQPDENLEYRLGNMLLDGEGCTKNVGEAVRYLELASGKGNQFSQYALGRLYLTGEDLPKDVNKAVGYLDAAAAQGNQFSQYALGRLYLSGEDLPKDVGKAVGYLDASAAQGNQFAQYALGRLYLTGEDLPKDVGKAVKYLDAAAAQGNQFAQYALGRLYLSGEDLPKDVNKAVKYLEASAAQGNQFSQYALGMLYLNGKEVPKDVQRGVDYLKASAAQGNQFAQYALGRLYLSGEDLPKDVGKAVGYLEAAAAQGNQFAQYALGRLYLAGEDLPKDVNKAVGYLDAAAAQGNQFAQYALGRLYLSGEDLPKDVGKAVGYLDAAAAQGNQFAQYALGRLYLSGEDLPKDVGKAVGYLDAAAAQGNQFAQYALGRLYLSGEDLPKDVNKAVGYLEASANQGNQFAQYALGRLYLSGEDLPKDVGKAVKYLEASANQNNQYAQYSLGMLYLNGKEVPKDVQKGLDYLKASAAQGNQYAQYALGRHNLSEGKRARAFEWFRKSAAQGNEYAKKAIDYINRPRARPHKRQASIIPAKALSAVRRLTKDYNRRITQLKREFDREMELKHDLEEELTQSLGQEQAKSRSL